MPSVPSSWKIFCTIDPDLVSTAQAYYDSENKVNRVRLEDLEKAKSGVRFPDGIIWSKTKYTLSPDGILGIPEPVKRIAVPTWTVGKAPHTGVRVCPYQSVYDNEDGDFFKRFKKYCTPIQKYVTKINDPALSEKYTSCTSDNYCWYCLYNAVMDVRKEQIEAEEVLVVEEERKKREEADKALIELVAEETRLKIAKKEVSKKANKK